MRKIENDIYEIDFWDVEYPEKLRVIANPPQKIYAKGNLKLLEYDSIGIVGSRKCTEYGKTVAGRIAKMATDNMLVVVSGMAKGIDSFAHWGAVNNCGKTIAVFGTGVDICYPRENDKLYNKILEDGLIISEQPPGTKPTQYAFPLRNRIISALSNALVVVEAATNSGALITAELANQQNKTVYAVPGNITSQSSLGTNKLIADGAVIVPVIDDIFYGMGIEPKLLEEELIKLGEDEKLIYGFVKEKGEISVDYICNSLDKPAIWVNSIVAILEIKGLVSYSLGKIFITK